jgi:hypothetical protein
MKDKNLQPLLVVVHLLLKENNLLKLEIIVEGVKE